MNSKIPRAVNDNETVEMSINPDEDYSISTKLNKKIRFAGQKKKRIKVFEMSCSILVKRSSKCRLGFLCGTLQALSLIFVS